MSSPLRLWLIGLMVSLAVVLVACGGSGSGSATVLEIGSDGETLAFDKPTLTAKAGELITLRLKNRSTSLLHNWVLVKGGDDVATTVNAAGAVAGAEKGYLPESPAILARVTQVKPGQTGETTFTVPAGTYTYLCTTIGHYPLMKGTLTVK